MARKQFIETPAQRINRVLKQTERLIAMSKIEQDEREQAQHDREREMSEYIPVAGGSVRRGAQERRSRERGEFSLMR